MGIHASSQMRVAAERLKSSRLFEPGRIPGLEPGLMYTAVSSHSNPEQGEVPLRVGRKGISFFFMIIHGFSFKQKKHPHLLLNRRQY